MRSINTTTNKAKDLFEGCAQDNINQFGHFLKMNVKIHEMILIITYVDFKGPT